MSVSTLGVIAGGEEWLRVERVVDAHQSGAKFAERPGVARFGGGNQQHACLPCCPWLV
jgi:hypothetical protein